MATLIEWAGTPWGIIILVGVAWFVVSCFFSVALGRIMAKFGGDYVPKLDQPQRRSPRRAGDAPGRSQTKTTAKNIHRLN